MSVQTIIAAKFDSEIVENFFTFFHKAIYKRLYGIWIFTGALSCGDVEEDGSQKSIHKLISIHRKQQKLRCLV